MSDTIQIPSGRLTFEVDGTRFDLSLLDTIRQLDAIRTEMKADPVLTRYDYLDRVKQLVQELGGPLLTDDQADWLDDQLEIQHAKKKQQRRSDFDSTLRLPSSTPSTRSA